MTAADTLAAAAKADLAAYGAAIRDCLEIAWPYLAGIAAILLYMHRKL